MEAIDHKLLQKKQETRGWEIIKELIDSAELNKEDQQAVIIALQKSLGSILCEKA